MTLLADLPRAILISALVAAAIPALMLIVACMGYLALVGCVMGWVDK